MPTLFNPSSGCRRLAGGRQRWKPAHDPEALLLPPLRAALPTPQQLRQAAEAQQQMLCQQQRAAAAAAELAGLTAADLDDWDEWDEEEGGGHSGWDCADAGADGWWEQGRQIQLVQQQPHQSEQQRTEAAIDLEWDEPAAGPAAVAAVSAMDQQQHAQREDTVAAMPSSPSRWLPVVAQARKQAGEAAAVDVCFDDDSAENAGAAAVEEPLCSG